MKELPVILTAYAKSGPHNIGETSDSKNAPSKIHDIYKFRKSIGVEFLKENGEQVRFVFLDSGHNFSAFQEEIQREAEGRICILGGDHAISYFTAKIFHEHNQNLKRGLIVLDAHPDLCHKGGPQNPCHSDWLRYLLEEKIFATTDIFCLGWRDIEPEEWKFAHESSLRNIILMSSLRFENMLTHDPYKFMLKRKLENFCSKFDAIYLSIDFDVIDPSFAPGVNTPSPCGLTNSQFVEFVKIVSQSPQVKVFDITEISPAKDINQTTQLLAIKTMTEMA